VCFKCRLCTTAASNLATPNKCARTATPDRCCYRALLSTMPNGRRHSYRCRPAGDNFDGLLLPPSPAHSSDSEETTDQKLRWRFVAWSVIFRWKFFIWRKQYWRKRKCFLLLSRWLSKLEPDAVAQVYDFAGPPMSSLATKPRGRDAYKPTRDWDWMEHLDWDWMEHLFDWPPTESGSSTET
jgi:hypothetical protein